MTIPSGGLNVKNLCLILLVFFTVGCQAHLTGDDPEPAPATAEVSANDTVELASNSNEIPVNPIEQVQPPQEGVNKPEPDDPSGPDLGWLCYTKWTRIGALLALAPSDDIAKFGYQEITFKLDGSYEFEGWHLGVNFKKVGQYELKGPKGFEGEVVYMHDTKILWMKDQSGKATDITNLIWTDGTYAQHLHDEPLGPALEV